MDQKEIGEKILEHIQKHFKQCPLCLNMQSKFEIMLAFSQILLTSGLFDRAVKRVIPTIPIVCTNCGYVIQIAAKKIGIIEKPKLVQETQNIPPDLRKMINLG